MDKKQTLKITEITFRYFGGADERIKAVASIVIENQLVIHEVRIIDGPLRGLFVAYPNKKLDMQDKNSCAHPINNETRIAWEKQILETYDTATAIGADLIVGQTFYFESSRQYQEPLTVKQLRTVTSDNPILVYGVSYDDQGKSDYAGWVIFDGTYFHWEAWTEELTAYEKSLSLFAASRR